MVEKTLNILLVEDDQVDVMNVKRAFDRNRITNPLYVAEDGLEGLRMLRSGEVPAERPDPGPQPTAGKFAGVIDPQGAHFMLFEGEFDE